MYPYLQKKVTLTCSTNDKSSHKFYWLNPANNYMDVSVDGSVTIPIVSRSDNGIYSCIVVNNFGNARSETKLRVDFYANSELPLEVSLSPKSRSVHEGTTLEFNCQVKNGPSQSINNVKWSRLAGDGEMLPKGRHTISGHVLRIENAKLNDTGKFNTLGFFL